MAKDGIIYGSFSGVAITGVRPAIEWSYTQNVNNNTSTITAVLVFYRYGYSPSWSSGHNVTFNVDGNSTTLSRPFDIRTRTRDVIWTRTRTVTHNSTGTRTVYMGASGSTGVSLGTYNFGETITFETIPRASTISVSNLTLGNNLPVTITRASTSFTHDFTLYFGTSEWVAEYFIANKTTSTSPILDINSTIQNRILDKMPTSTSATLRLRCRTYNGSTAIGTSYATLTVSIPNTAAYKPSISGLTADISGSGVDSQKGKFVQGISKASVNYNYAINGRTTLKSIDLTIDGTVYGSGVPKTSNVLQNSGTRSIVLKVTDNRGRFATDSLSIVVESYSPPTVNYLQANRDSGTSATIEWQVKWAGIGNLSYSLRRYVVGSTSYTEVDSETYTSGNSRSDWYIDTVSSANSYEYRIVISDEFGRTTTGTYTVGTAFVPVSIGPGGLGAGKSWERGALDVAGDIYQNNTMLSNLFAASSHNHSASDINSGTLSYLRIPRGTTSTTVATGNHGHTNLDVKGLFTHEGNDVLKLERVDNLSSSVLITESADHLNPTIIPINQPFVQASTRLFAFDLSTSSDFRNSQLAFFFFRDTGSAGAFMIGNVASGTRHARRIRMTGNPNAIGLYNATAEIYIRAVYVLGAY